MGNDFIEGMEILIKCKQYVEWRLNYLYELIGRMDRVGKSTEAVQYEIIKLETALGYKKPTTFRREIQ